ncbi:MAG: argininosuccinate lyase [Rhodospirillales bacterium]|jgi:argininosuccinate lyase|nr:argininosuccinate lyase [Rhodospirillales bacterium]MBT4039021.1 argininosuccinate lyase [Rhodospirillales bacterium]MBT4628051.1 argininosuccinate lyase [Rhodospirillales bacterium]MBT5352573.1 argininosuccinate lyase [Rhodospirillales bacterium]MBT5520897.1 argininosuccinate lyase [Rhodospirillales bacterium]
MTDENTKSRGNTSTMWGGRFNVGPDAVMEAINASIGFDQRLYAQDIQGSKAHAAMLTACHIISAEDEAQIQQGLDTILAEIETGDFAFSTALEDIHMNVESRLAELIGDAAGRLHTARSRNDQVATDLKLWVRDSIDGLDSEFRRLQAAMIDMAEQHAATIMPGFTHMQAAQPVTFGHHLLAYVEMLGRDRGRLADCRARANQSPLGAAALAGTSFAIDRNMTATAMGFDGPATNSMDAVSDRDFVLELLSASAIAGIHLSRLAEEIVIWASAQFGFIRLSDGFSTGSSIMPQKRNPDAAELVRGKVGRIVGSLNTMLVVMKALPMTYGKDMQEDKEPVFDAVDTLGLCLAAMRGMIEGMEANEEKMQDAVSSGFITATDLADWLVRTLDLPFRNAHHVTGELVKLAEGRGLGLEDLSLKDMQSVEEAITEDVFSVLGVENSVASRTSFGGTSPENVKAAAIAARKRFL